jgi:hypothetical protein
MYALFAFIMQRRGDHSRARGRGRKLSFLALAGGVLGLGLVLWCCFSHDHTDPRLKFAGFLGTVYAEGFSVQPDRVEYPPIKTQSQEAVEQPAYALLHPETPASQIKPEKKLLRPRPGRVVKKPQSSNLLEKSGKTAKVAKTAVPSNKKDKMVGKSRAKKKKRPSATESKQTDAG